MIRKGTQVRWKWGKGYASGKIVETYTTSITKKISGSTITRNGEPDNKALLIEQGDGSKVLKSESEVERD